MGLFDSLDKGVSKFFNNLKKKAVDSFLDEVENAKLSPEAMHSIDRQHKTYENFNYSLKHKENLNHVKDRFNSLESYFINGIIFSEETVKGLDSKGNLSSGIVLFKNEAFSGMIYSKIHDEEFNVSELLWIRRFVNGLLHGISEDYNYNSLVSYTFYENGIKIKKEEYKKAFDQRVVDQIESIIEYDNENNYKRCIYDSHGIEGSYKLELYKNNQPHGEWQEYSIETWDYDLNKGINRFLSAKKYYHQGKENGKWEWFDKNGTVIKTQYWKNGSDKFLKDEIEKLAPGFEYSSTIQILGEPDFIKNSISNGKTRKKVYYGKSINRLGNDAYAFEITFVDDKVYGYKQLGQVGYDKGEI